MPRQPRADEAGTIYHALNRGNRRQTIFYKDEDYEAFLRVLAEGLAKYAVEMFAFTLETDKGTGVFFASTAHKPATAMTTAANSPRPRPRRLSA